MPAMEHKTQQELDGLSAAQKLEVKDILADQTFSAKQMEDLQKMFHTATKVAVAEVMEEMRKKDSELETRIVRMETKQNMFMFSIPVLIPAIMWVLDKIT